MPMLAGVRKWSQKLTPDWTDLFEQGYVIHTGDSGIQGQGEGQGALVAGKRGLAWVICGALGGIVSRKAGQASWTDLRYLRLNDPPSLTFGYESSGREGSVTFGGQFDRYSTGAPGDSSAERFQMLAFQGHLAEEGWKMEGQVRNWYRPKP